VELLTDHPQSVRELTRHLPVSRPAVSKHLLLLSHAGLVTHKPDGASNLYSLDIVGFENARNWLDGFWNEALGRFRLVAENLPPEENHE